MTSTPALPRLSKAHRREQLLDVAAELLVRSGATAITMERVAEQAGVSKALPYQHFSNATEMLLALHVREVTQLGRRITRAVDAAIGADAGLRAAVAAYFEVIAERGVLLGILGREAVPDGTVAVRPDGQRFVADLLSDAYGISGTRALVLAEIVQGSLLGAVTAWGRGDASRRTVQAMATDSLLAMVATSTGQA